MKLGYIIDGEFPDFYVYKPVFGLDEQDKTQRFDDEQERIMFAYWDIHRNWS